MYNFIFIGLPSDVQLALSGLKQRLTEVINRELMSTEERIRQYSEQQFSLLEKFREKAHKEHKILARYHFIIFNLNQSKILSLLNN